MSKKTSKDKPIFLYFQFQISFAKGNYSNKLREEMKLKNNSLEIYNNLEMDVSKRLIDEWL